MSAAPEPPPKRPAPQTSAVAAGGGRIAPDGVAGRVGALLSAFRAQNRFFKWRVAVIAAWIVLGLGSVAFGLSGFERNPLGASVRVVQTGLGHAIHVRNDGRHPWQDVRLEIPGGFVFERHTVRPDESFSVRVSEFSRTTADGTVEHADRDHSPRQVIVHTRAGQFEADTSHH